jgi:phosphate transport system substrate-binding protein
MKMKEFDLCQSNGVTDIIEVKIGFDGIVIGNAIDSPAYDLTRQDIYKALAAEVTQYGRTSENAFGNWSEVNPSLPAQPIEVLGPPPTSGTRDAFEELAMQAGARDAGLDKAAAKKVTVRSDGAYIEAGENDNLIVSKLEADPAKLGVFGFSFLDQNADRIKGAKVEGVEPTFDNIASGDYPVSRDLWFYVKKAHIGVIPGIAEYMTEFLDEDAIGEDGYAVEKGLIPLEEDELEQFQSAVTDLTVMTGEEELH